MINLNTLNTLNCLKIGINLCQWAGKDHKQAGKHWYKQLWSLRSGSDGRPTIRVSISLPCTCCTVTLYTGLLYFSWVLCRAFCTLLCCTMHCCKLYCCNLWEILWRWVNIAVREDRGPPQRFHHGKVLNYWHNAFCTLHADC